jgi:hypothetical protein
MIVPDPEGGANAPSLPSDPLLKLWASMRAAPATSSEMATARRVDRAPKVLGAGAGDGDVMTVSSWK